MHKKCGFLIACGLFAAAVQAAELPDQSPTPSYVPLRGAQCMEPAQARGWAYIDDSHLLVDGGRYKYRVELSARCSALNYTVNIMFRGDPVTGRVCGGLNDAVVTRDYPCRIGQMTLLSKEEYQQALKDAEAARQADKEAKKAAKAEAKSDTP